MKLDEGHFITDENLDKAIDDAYKKGYNDAIDKMKSIVNDHSNTEKVSTSKLFYGKHVYYRSIYVSKFCRLAEQLKAGE